MRRLPFILITLAALLTACASSPAKPTATTLTVETFDIGYKTTALNALVGAPVELDLKNTGALDHDWTIMEIHADGIAEHSSDGMHMDHSALGGEPALHVAAMAGKTATVTFTPEEAGTYEYFCTVPGHKEAGMHGTLTIK